MQPFLTPPTYANRVVGVPIVGILQHIRHAMPWTVNSKPVTIGFTRRDSYKGLSPFQGSLGFMLVWGTFFSDDVMFSTLQSHLSSNFEL